VKRAVILLCAILGFTTLATVHAQTKELPKIAVYVTGKLADNEKEALGTKIFRHLVQGGRYAAVERSAEFLVEVNKELLTQQSGAIDDKQITKVGERFGVDFVCIVRINPVYDEYQVSAKIIDTKTTHVPFIGEASTDKPKKLDDLEMVSSAVVNSMFKGQSVSAPAPSGGGSSFTDSRNGQKYRTVKIGGKTWMAENLNYAMGQSWCYDNSEPHCEEYGRLYDWQTAKGACPKGWHLPTQGEWNSLLSAVGGSEFAGKKLKSTSGWNSHKHGSGNGTDDYGFSALPGGYRYSGGSCDDVGDYGYWWSASERDAGGAYYRRMYYDLDCVYESASYESYGFSVRCVKDD
jgi:uncharacterized protein (TIGR02145 family)